jgi:hypothetical protein
MTTAFVIDVEHGVVFSYAWGKITLDEVTAFRRRLFADAQFKREYRQLLDFTLVTEIPLSSQDIYMLAQQPVFEPQSRRAVVTNDSLQYGLTRMFQAYNQSQNVSLFRDLNEALTWLDVSVDAYRTACTQARASQGLP